MSFSFHSFRKKSGLVLCSSNVTWVLFVVFVLLYILAASRIFSLILGFRHYQFDDSRHVCGRIFSFLLGIHLKMELLVW